MVMRHSKSSLKQFFHSYLDLMGPSICPQAINLSASNSSTILVASSNDGQVETPIMIKFLVSKFIAINRTSHINKTKLLMRLPIPKI